MTAASAIDVDAIAAEISWIKARLAEIEHTPAPPSGDWQAWCERDRILSEKHAKLRDELTARGARISAGPTSMRIRHLGVSTTCTAGLPGLLRNWINAAKRRIEQEA